MNPIAKLFSKTPSASEIDQKLKDLELDQKKKRRDLVMLEQKKQEKVQRAVQAKQAGRQTLVKDLFREVSQIEIEIGYANSDLRRLSLSKTALSSFLRKMKLLEQKKDRNGLRKLIERFGDTSFQNTIDKATVDDDTFKDLLEDVLGEEEGAADRSRALEDSGFAEFDQAIGEMARTGEAAVPIEEPPDMPIDVEPPAARLPDMHPPENSRQQARSPDNYPSYGNKSRTTEAPMLEPVAPRVGALAGKTCPDCQGTGSSRKPCDNGCDLGKLKKTCPTCRGDKEVPCPECQGMSGRPCPDGPCGKCRPPYSGYLWKYCDLCRNTHYAACTNARCKSGSIYDDCDRCQGTGAIRKDCPSCAGTGTLNTETRVAIPAPAQAAETQGEYPLYGDRRQASNAHGGPPGHSAISAMESSTCPDCKGNRGFEVPCDGGCTRGKLLAKCGTCGGNKAVLCPNCQGRSGPVPCPMGQCENCVPPYSGMIMRNCPTCQNQHYVRCPNDNCVDGYVLVDCQRCRGTGTLWKQCEKCRGTGAVDS